MRPARAALASLIVAASLVHGTALHAEGTNASTSLKDHFGVGAAETLGASDSLTERLRGLERLGAIGTPRAVLRLVRALEPGGAAKAPEERLIAVRQLALHTDDAGARRALARVLGGHSSSAATETPSVLDDLAERTAALALARSQAPDALASLGKALESPGRAALAAEAALVAHPPRDLSPVLATARVPSVSLVRALDGLGDQRAFDTLRDLVRIGSPEVRAAAAVALTRLGDFETVELSRRWLSSNAPMPLRIAAARILSMAHAEGAARATIALLEDPSYFDIGLELALDAPSPELVPALAKFVRTSSGTRADDLLAALGRAGGEQAADVLAALLDDATLGAVAAYHLGRMPGKAPARDIADRLGRPSSRRLAARAATVRKLVLGEQATNVRPVLESLLRSNDAADRAAGATGLSVLEPDRIAGFVASKDDVVVRAAASCLLLAPRDVGGYVAERLLATASGDTETALALALAVPGANERAPTRVLLALVGSGGAAAPLAARALAARDAGAERERLDELLASSDPELRAHVALGLGASKERDAAGRLEAGYRLEPDPVVRLAIVRALSVRSEPSSARVLGLAAAFDPDADVRAAASRFTGPAPAASPTAETAVAWIPVVNASDDGPAPATVAVEVPGGLALPAATAPDGVVLLSGLPEGPVFVRVAPARERDNASERGAAWQAGK
ncbi:MAG TPA: HEAT repeat domain-containing protein [Polyangiaceae bacterium]|jgi:hypothetical protein|nr:HEAT repeat domain-containing protein [Polyangiaceae bacterium]